jgi:hypothetical protein
MGEITGKLKEELLLCENYKKRKKKIFHVNSNW